MRHKLTFAWAQSMRSTSCSLLISKENMPTGTFAFTAVCLAISSAKEVFPTLGRAAKTTKSDFCRPASSLSRSVKPVGSPRIFPLCLCSSSMRSKASVSNVSIGRKICLRYFCETLNNFCSASSNIFSISSSSLYPSSVISVEAVSNLLSVALRCIKLA